MTLEIYLSFPSEALCPSSHSFSLSRLTFPLQAVVGGWEVGPRVQSWAPKSRVLAFSSSASWDPSVVYRTGEERRIKSLRISRE